jgi:hypothetical protein
MSDQAQPLKGKRNARPVERKRNHATPTNKMKETGISFVSPFHTACGQARFF